jgi:hypothetical protein
VRANIYYGIVFNHKKWMEFWHMLQHGWNLKTCC